MGTSAFKVGASVIYEVDRGRSRAGLCGLRGYEWAGEGRVETALASGKSTTITSTDSILVVFQG